MSLSGCVAQLVEHWIPNPKVVGSNPATFIILLLFCKSFPLKLQLIKLKNQRNCHIVHCFCVGVHYLISDLTLRLRLELRS